MTQHFVYVFSNNIFKFIKGIKGLHTSELFSDNHFLIVELKLIATG